MKKLGMLGIIGGAALLTVAPFSLQWSQDEVFLSLNSANAQTEEPTTETRIAGPHRKVHRRTYRRAAYAVTPATVAGYGYGSYSGYGYGSYSYYGYTSSFYSSYYAPRPYWSYYRPVSASVRAVSWRYPPSRYSYYLSPFASVSSYDEYRTRP